MTALFTADLHLSEQSRDKYRDDWMLKLPDLAKKHKCNQVIIGGDLSEEKDEHRAWLVNRVAYHMHRLTEAGMHVIIYTGNHDYVDEDEVFWTFLAFQPNVTFVTRPTALTIGGLGKCLFLPHTRDWKRDWSGEMLNRRYAYIFAHQTFAGSVADSGYHIERGVPTDIFCKGECVLSGDVHTPQRVGPVEYVGAPYTVDFGDDYEPRVLLLSNGSFVSVPCSGPQKRLLEISDVKQLAKDKTCGAGDIVKVRVTIKGVAPSDWQPIADGVNAWAEKRKLNLHSIQPVIVKPEGKRSVQTGLTNARTNDADTLDDYGRSRGVDDRTMKTGHFIMDRSK